VSVLGETELKQQVDGSKENKLNELLKLNCAPSVQAFSEIG
jgi:hypothetical protein